MDADERFALRSGLEARQPIFGGAKHGWMAPHPALAETYRKAALPSLAGLVLGVRRMTDIPKYVTRAALVSRGRDSVRGSITRTAEDYRNAKGDDDGYITYGRDPRPPAKDQIEKDRSSE